ncbi:MAG: aldo/keto reductase [Firmicutes bacterium]|nr:aldo/keto reductase [Bacillota bacterium]
MDYRVYPNSKKLASRLGFGSWQLGNAEFWSPMTEQEGVMLVKEAVKNGITFFDTAPGYASGKSEVILGIALKDSREQVIINSKFGHRADGRSDFSSASIEEAIHESLDRLQTSYLDSLILHNPGKDILSGQTDHFKVLKKMQEKGLILAYGVSIDSVEELKLTLENTDSLVIEIMYNVFHQISEEWLNQAKEKGVAIIAKVPLDSGWLSGKYDQFTVFTGIRDRWSFDDKKRRFDLCQKLRFFTRDKNLTKYALGFIKSIDAITCIIPGIHSMDHLLMNLEFAEYDMPDSLKKQFIKLYESEIKNNPLPW